MKQVYKHLMHINGLCGAINLVLFAVHPDDLDYVVIGLLNLIIAIIIFHEQKN